MEWTIVFSRHAKKDLEKIKANKSLKRKVCELFEIIEKNPYQNPPRYEKLQGDLEGKFSRRINIQHRLVYEVDEQEKQVKVLSVWTHYEF